MIYFKRFWNVIAAIVASIAFVCFAPLVLLESIVELVYYVATGTSFVDNHCPIVLRIAIGVYEKCKFNDV